uniref:Uncharacterized protein n=1 Tax=Myotis myotis TaxID=51298 RepID=A0A7J7R070_MYOMY|nr:hypothetical protein mMyoMyo1_011238 [Myotis myotis]
MLKEAAAFPGLGGHGRPPPGLHQDSPSLPRKWTRSCRDRGAPPGLSGGKGGPVLTRGDEAQVASLVHQNMAAGCPRQGLSAQQSPAEETNGDQIPDKEAGRPRATPRGAVRSWRLGRAHVPHLRGPGPSGPWNRHGH